MEKLWAPWRMKYIKDTVELGSQECFLCEAAQKIPDQSNLVVKKFSSTLVMLNLYPYNSGHILIAPFQHVNSLGLLNDSEIFEIMKALQISENVVREIYKPDGMNLGMNIGREAGAGIPDHIHFHIVPRWNGDTNFMPIISQTKVISEALDVCYENYKKKFDTIMQIKNPVV